MRLILFLLFAFWVVSATGTEIYKCVRADGVVLFKDTPCSIKDLQSMYQYTEQPITKQDVLILQRKFKRYNEEAIKKRQHEARQQLRLEKQQELEQKRRLRLRDRCEKVMAQIAALDQRYRRGYTAKQRQSLDRKLAEYQIKKQKHCK